MTLKIYIGTADEITARLAGSPDATTTTVSSASSTSTLKLTSATSFSVGDSIVIGKEKAIIETLVGVDVTLERSLLNVPTPGTLVRHYNADYTQYRDQGKPFTFVDDRKTGGSTGTVYGQDLVLFDYDAQMPDVVEQHRITIFDSVNPTEPLYAGVIVSSAKVMMSKNGNTPVYQWTLETIGHQWEADSVGIDEKPFVNVNAGKFLDYLRSKYTNLTVGEIDMENSPTINYIRLSNVRRFSSIGQDLVGLWPGAEFFIKNTHTGGEVYFRQAVSSYAPITLDQDYLEKIGNRSDQYVRITKDYDKVYNTVLLPYYRDQERDPDYFVQSTVTDNAFLRTTALLSGQPASIEEAVLFFDDFSDGTLQDGFLELDLSNPSPPTGHTNVEGFLIEGEINGVTGLHALPPGTIPFGSQICRITDPSSLQPFNGSEGQLIFLKELVVNTVGLVLLFSVLDQTTFKTTTKSGSTTTRVYVNDVLDGFSPEGFGPGDVYIRVGNDISIIDTVGSDYLDLFITLSNSPATGVTVEVIETSPSRRIVDVAIESGSLKTYKMDRRSPGDGFHSYNAGAVSNATTYSIRAYMQCFETTIASGISPSGCTLSDVSNFTDTDIVEIYTRGSRFSPEVREISLTGSAITYSATNFVPEVGYRIRTKPKLIIQAKGGAFGDINGRDWSTIFKDELTWQSSESVDPPYCGVILLQLFSTSTFAGTLTQFSIRNPPPITANIGDRYLHLGTQEVDSSEPDIDAIVRKVGSHYQLDFFPDTKYLWESESTLELRYKERWRLHMEAKNLNSIRELAEVRGYDVPDNATEEALTRMGGRSLDSIQILPTPITDSEAISQSDSIIQAVSEPAYTIEIATNTVLDDLCQSGQVIQSAISGTPDMQIERVEIREFAGTDQYSQKIYGGTVDRLTDILNKRQLVTGSRLVLDDGKSDDDTYTMVKKIGYGESMKAQEEYAIVTTPFYFALESGGHLLTENGSLVVSE